MSPKAKAPLLSLNWPQRTEIGFLRMSAQATGLRDSNCQTMWLELGGWEKDPSWRCDVGRCSRCLPWVLSGPSWAPPTSVGLWVAGAPRLTHHLVFEVFQFISVECEPSLLPVLDRKDSFNTWPCLTAQSKANPSLAFIIAPCFTR